MNYALYELEPEILNAPLLMLRTRHWGTPLPPPNPLAEDVSTYPKARFASVPSVGAPGLDKIWDRGQSPPSLRI